MSEGKNNTVMLILSYFGLLALIPYFVEKEDPEVRWHASQGLALCGASFAFFVILGILTMCIAVVPVIGWIVSFILSIAMLPLALVVMVVSIICMIKAIKGERWRLPVVADWADKLAR